MTDELLVKYLLNETSAEENVLVSEWIASDPSHQKHFNDLELIWKTSKNLASQSTVDENDAWERFKLRTVQVKSKPDKVKIKPIRTSNLWIKIAASLVIVASAVFFLFKSSEKNISTMASVSVEILPDGSEITLNKNSSLTYTSSLLSSKRKVSLTKGEVFFKVKPDKSKPFLIDAQGVLVEVVGTEFNVKHTPSKTEIIVESGIVKVSEGSETVELHAGEKVNVHRKQTLVIERNTDDLYNYYRTKTFVANNTPLWRVVEVLNEAYSSNIIIENPALKNLTLNTTFRNESLSQILKVISETFNISVTQKDKKIILK